jgi:hypothetical protein
LDQEGIIGGNKSGFLRNTARVSLGVDLSDKLKLKQTLFILILIVKSEDGLGSV